MMLCSGAFAQQRKFSDIQKAMNLKFKKEEKEKLEEKEKNKMDKHKDDEDDDYAKYKRWEWWAERHLNARGYLEDEVQKSFDMVFGKNNSSSQTLQSRQTSVAANWTELSHTPFSTSVDQMGKGRIDCIVEVPGTANVLVGTAGGGLWLGGRPSNFLPFIWTALTDGLPRMSITDICINPNNINEIYIATGSGDDNDIINTTSYTNSATQSRSLGILKSTDGGINWSRTSMNFQNSDQRIIYRMIIDPANPQVMYAATLNGLFRTTNGWNTNQQIMTGQITDVKLKTDNNQVLFTSSFNAAGTANNIISRVNSDGTGLSQIFTFPGSPARTVLGVTPANGSYLYVLGGDNTNGFKGLYKCTNSGGATPSFNLQSSSPDILNYNASGSGLRNKNVFYDIVIAVHPQNAERVYAGGLNLWESTDGGVNWNVKSDWTTGQSSDLHCHSDFHQLKFSSNNTLYNCNDGGLFSMDLASYQWKYYSSGVNNTEYYRISIISQNLPPFYTGRLILGGTQDNGELVWRTTGLTKAVDGDGMDNAMASSDGSKMIASSQNGKIKTSGNGGGSFSSPAIPPAEYGNGAWVTPIVQHCSVPEYIYLGFKNIYHNPGFWDNYIDVINTNFPNPIVAMCQGNYTTPTQPGTNVLYCGVQLTDNKYHLFRIENNLLSTKTDLGAFSNIITAVKCDPNNARNVYVTLGGLGDNNKVFYSNDRGQTFKNISGTLNADGALPDLAANCIALLGGGGSGIYVGMDVGVYFLADPFAVKPRWIRFSNGLPNIPVTDLEIDVNTQEIFAATYGRGLWKSSLHEICPAILDISGSTIGVSYYQASDVINSTSTTSGGYGSKVTLNAGNEIVLGDGYSVAEGSGLYAYIQGCTTSPRDDSLFSKKLPKQINKPFTKSKTSGKINQRKKGEMRRRD